MDQDFYTVSNEVFMKSVVRKIFFLISLMGILCVIGCNHSSGGNENGSAELELLSVADTLWKQFSQKTKIPCEEKYES